MKIGKPVPVLRIFDEAKAKDFYVDFLGFRVDWEHRFEDGLPLYAGLSKDDCVIHLSEHHGDACPGSAVRISMKGIKDYCQELLGKKYKYYRPGVEETPWKSLDMEVKDPFGNKLVFTEEL